MRFLASARIVVLDADPAHRSYVCSALSEFGLLQVLPAACVSDAHRLRTEHSVDLCVVDSRGFIDAGTSSPNRMVPNPFREYGTPAILIAENTSLKELEAASAAGYRVVLGAPVVPRLLYRRIGSILQKRRRTGRDIAP